MKVGKSVITELVHGWKKPQVHKKERAEFIQSYLDENKLSVRAFAKEIDVHHNTVQDWLLWNDIDKEEIEEHIDNGFTETEIYRDLRNNRKHKQPKQNSEDYILRELRMMKNRVKSLLKYNKKNIEAYHFIKEIKESLDILEKRVGD